MPRTVVQKTSFLGGEAGPLLEGRSDLAQFQLGSRRQQNFITLKGGAATRRPGTRYCKNTLNNKPARIIPFIFSYNGSNDQYVVEITQASSTTLEFRVITPATGSATTPTVTTPTNSTLTVDATLTNIDEIQFAQSADTMFLVHKSFAPQMLLRTSTSPAFTLTPYIAYVDPGASRKIANSLPYFDKNITATTATLSAAVVGAQTLTFSVATLAGDASDVGKWFRMISGGAAIGSMVVTAFTSSTVCTVNLIESPDNAGPSTGWWEGAWSPSRGWPRTVCFYSQRLVFGGNTYRPDTFWMSKVANYLQMANTGAAFAINDPLFFQLASNKLNQIQWMVGGKKHTIGTTFSEWVGTVTNDGTNLFVQYDEETTHGSAPVQPSRSAYAIPFVQRAGQTMREMVFDFYSDNYQATDLNLFSSQVGVANSTYDSNAYDVYIKATAMQESPNTILWAIDSVGRLWGMTRDKQQQIASWHSHLLGGTFTVGGGFVNSICTMPSTNGRTDRLWMVVKRTINGATKYHVEYMDDLKCNSTMKQGFFLATNNDVTDIRTFLDCADYAQTGLTDTDGHNTTAWSGYTRFASDNAYVVAVRSNSVVFAGVLAVDGSGNITLPTKAQAVIVGLHAQAELRLLPLEGGDAPKINTRSIKRIDLVTLRLFETYGLRIGKDRLMQKGGYVDNTTGFEAINFDLPSQTGNLTFTGFKEVQVPQSADTDASFALVMQEPWPCTVLAVSSRFVTNEV